MRILPLLALALLWLLLTDASLASWIIGIPFILLALAVIPRSPAAAAAAIEFRPTRLPGFLAYFIVESLRGGLDVSRRVFSARPAITPTFFDYALRLESTPARQLFINCISLLPGTLSADWLDDRLRIHSLDDGPQASAEVRRLEHGVARLFGESL